MKVPCKITLEGDKACARNFMGAAQSQMQILENQMSFQKLKQGARRIQLTPRIRIEARVCFSLREVIVYCKPKVQKLLEKKFEKLPKLYVYVTISDYVIIWDLETGEVAENIRNSSNSLVTFPCHKDELVTWLKGIKGKPTRQVLKDDPVDNRDYLPDNQVDIGNETRLELKNLFDPGCDLYYGTFNPTFTNVVRDETIDLINPRCCYEADCVVTPINFTVGRIVEVNEPDEYEESFRCTKDFEYGKECYMQQYYGPWRRCRKCPYSILLETEAEHIQKYSPRTKHLYLGPYPSPVFNRPVGGGLPSKEVEYSTEEESAYEEAIDIEWDNTEISVNHVTNTPDWPVKRDFRQGDVGSINTKLGRLVIDYIPYREWEEGTERIYERMRDATESALLLTYLRDGVCHSVSEWEARGALWPSCISPDHATSDCNWCTYKTRSAIDLKESESNRTGITWCGSPAPGEQTQGWYRVILNFYTGNFHTSGREAMQDWISDFSYCPNEEMCEELIQQGAQCTATSWVDEPTERFSSVQATIELENPKEYSGDIDIALYQRPDDYEGHEEDFTQLCAFPGRTQGYPEDEGKNICYPFDGTYVLHTLSKAVEELINNHYVDGSDDQLLVYLYERPDMIEKEKEEK